MALHHRLVGRVTGGSFGQWIPSGQSWRKQGVGTGWYGSQAVNFPTPVTVDGGPERFDITIRMCRGDDGSYINATGHYVTSAVNSMSVTPTSATLQSLVELSLPIMARLHSMGSCHRK